MDEDSSSNATPTALVKIFGDFDTRVKTASRRTADHFEGLQRRPSGSLLTSSQSSSGLLNRKSTFSAVPRGRLVFDESGSPRVHQTSRQKRPSSTLNDPLSGLDRYPKAMRTDDTRSLHTEIGTVHSGTITT